MTYGFKKPTIKKEDYRFGALPKDMLTDGDWTPYLPVFEHQRKGTETMACVSFGTNSALEMIHKVKYGVEPNYSDRYLAKLSDTSRTGNTPNKVAQTLRDEGCVKQELWDFTDSMTWEEFYEDVPVGVRVQGQRWLNGYDFGYEWVDHNETKEALLYSPIGVAVYAWNKRGDVYLQNKPVNHWCVLVKYEDGHPIIWDSYEENLKKLPKNTVFKYAMRYSLYKRESRKNWFDSLVESFISFLKDIWR